MLVADRSNHRLQYFDLAGTHLRFAGEFDLPSHFDIDRDGTLLVPDLAAPVSLFNEANELIGHLGVGLEDYRQRRLRAREHFPDGKFVCPHGACFDHDGNIFVVEWVEIGRGTFLKRVRESGRKSTSILRGARGGAFSQDSDGACLSRFE